MRAVGTAAFVAMAIVSTACEPSTTRLGTSALPLAAGEYAFIQSEGVNVGYPPTQSTVSVTLPAPTLEGSLLLVSVGWGELAVDVSQVQDDVGEAFLSAVGPTTWGVLNNLRQQLFYGVTAGGATQVSVAMTATPQGYLEARAYEFAGVEALGAPAGVNAAIGDSTRPSVDAIGVLGPAVLFTVAQHEDAAVSFVDAGQGFTMRPVGMAGGGMMFAERLVPADAGVVTASFDLDGVRDWVILTAGFPLAADRVYDVGCGCSHEPSGMAPLAWLAFLWCVRFRRRAAHD